MVLLPQTSPYVRLDLDSSSREGKLSRSGVDELFPIWSIFRCSQNR